MSSLTKIQKLYQNAEALFYIWEASDLSQDWDAYQKAKDEYLIAVFGDLETAEEAK